VPVVRDATPDDAQSIGEAHAEAWRIGYEHLFPPTLLEPAVDLRLRMWVGLVGDQGLGGTLLVAEETGDVTSAAFGNAMDCTSSAIGTTVSDMLQPLHACPSLDRTCYGSTQQEATDGGLDLERSKR
jgi:hypothetical protein